MKIAIITPGGISNFGERAIMLGTVYKLRELHSKATIAVFGYQELAQEDPRLHAELDSLGVTFYKPIIWGANRWVRLGRALGGAFMPRLFLPRDSYNFLKQAKVYAKGQESLTQDYGFVHFIDSVIEPLIVSRITKDITLLGHSIGPIYKHKWFSSLVVRRFSKIHVRDSHSKAVLKDLGYDERNVTLIKDLAYSAVDHYDLGKPGKQRGHYLLVPNAAICSTPQLANQYKQNLRRIVENLLQRNDEVIVGSSVIADDWNNDYQLCRQLKAEYNKIELREYHALDEFLRDVKSAKQVISSRLHPLIMATGLGTEVLALSRSHKVKGLLSDLGLQTNIVDPFQAIDRERLH